MINNKRRNIQRTTYMHVCERAHATATTRIRTNNKIKGVDIRNRIGRGPGQGRIRRTENTHECYADVLSHTREVTSMEQMMVSRLMRASVLPLWYTAICTDTATSTCVAPPVAVACWSYLSVTRGPSIGDGDKCIDRCKFADVRWGFTSASITCGTRNRRGTCFWILSTFNCLDGIFSRLSGTDKQNHNHNHVHNHNHKHREKKGSTEQKSNHDQQQHIYIPDCAVALLSSCMWCACVCMRPAASSLWTRRFVAPLALIRAPSSISTISLNSVDRWRALSWGMDIRNTTVRILNRWSWPT